MLSYGILCAKDVAIVFANKTVLVNISKRFEIFAILRAIRYRLNLVLLYNVLKQQSSVSCTSIIYLFIYLSIYL